jgi:hypothetical protein
MPLRGWLAFGSQPTCQWSSGVGRAIWFADRILKIAEPDWPGAAPIDQNRPGAMCKLVFEPTGELLEAGVLANVPSPAEPKGTKYPA